MDQRLLVEGSDAIALANIFIKRKIPAPKGYKNVNKFKTQFVKSANGYDKIKTVLKEELQSSNVGRIGIIVDANEVGPEARLKSLLNFIEIELNTKIENTKLDSKGFYVQLPNNLSIGIWIMPNNKNNGYLEHFLSELITEQNQTLAFANATLNQLSEKEFCLFSKVKKQKALVHTYLAWQKTPGLPFGSAIQSGFLDASSPSADVFVDWFQKTFELEMP